MPQSFQFKEKETGNIVDAIQAQHPGRLLTDKMESFETDDWIVTLPIDLIGERHRIVLSPQAFRSRFVSLGDKQFDWAKMQWVSVE